MKVSKDILEGVRLVRSPNIGGPMKPEAIVVHYTSGGHQNGSIDWLTKRDGSGLSAHLVIGREGEVTQLVPFNVEAFHAGKSSHGGRTGFNHFSIGIELANWGPLTLQHGFYLSWAGKDVPKAQVFRGQHRNAEQYPALRTSQYWEQFPAAQINALVEVCTALRETYPILSIVGHDDIAPDRKTDPGPAFDMEAFMSRVLGLDVSEPDKTGENVATGQITPICAGFPLVDESAIKPEQVADAGKLMPDHIAEADKMVVDAGGVSPTDNESLSVPPLKCKTKCKLKPGIEPETETA